MRPDEMRDSGAALGTALDEVTEIVRDVHRAVAGRLFGLVGQAGRPVELMHDGIAAIAYTSTRVGVRLLPAAIGLGASAVHDPASPSAHDSARGRFVLSALNGFWGDRYRDRRPAIAPTLRMRTHDGELRADMGNVAHDAAASATGRVVVLVHGLCETDQYWGLGAEKAWGDASATYGSKLRDDDGWTPLYVHYNTGLHIAENARLIANQLEDLVALWPVPVQEVALVGHSMGGLVVRSTAHHGAEAGHRWTTTLRHVVGLGAPHLGAPLEQFVARRTHAMWRRPETRPFAAWLDKRSVGIKDLRHGSIVEADWWGLGQHCQDDACTEDRCTEVALAPGVAYSMASATLSLRPDGRFAHDLLVAHGSANGIGPTRSLGFDPARTVHIGLSTHFDLLRSPRIYDALRTWLATPIEAMGATPVKSA